MVVSDYLGGHLQKLFSISNPILIPNVVDADIFNISQVAYVNEKSRFVHISTLTYQKNPEDMLKAFSIVKQKGYDFSLEIIGPLRQDLLQLTQSLGIQNEVFFYGEMPQGELAKILQSADALVLYSRYETFGCVLIEANACGLPVIVSDIPVVHENVVQNYNGVFAAPENAIALADQIIFLINNKQSFNSEKISATALQKYSYKNVGSLFSKWYQNF